MPNSTSSRRVVPNDVRVIEQLTPAHSRTGRKRLLGKAHIVRLVAAYLKEQDRFVATMNMGPLTPQQRAVEMVDRYFAATRADFKRCDEVIARQRRELGIA